MKKYSKKTKKYKIIHRGGKTINNHNNNNVTLTVTYPDNLTLTSNLLANTDFTNAYTAGSLNKQPNINLSDTDTRNKQYIIIMYDPDTPSGNFIHWIVKYSMPSRNLDIIKPYIPPTPPPHDIKTHHYYFKVYSTSESNNIGKYKKMINSNANAVTSVMFSINP